MAQQDPHLLTFGPVPSRRLGRSLGINNIPPKACSYSCVYCQVGRTMRRETCPRAFYSPEEIRNAVVTQVEAARRAGESIDYLTFVPDGEPTLDSGLSETIDLLRPLDIKIAVISNGSLVWRDDVRAALNKADWVSLKVDTVDETLWHHINRPHEALSLSVVLQGMLGFARQFNGELATETMLVAGINTGVDAVGAVATFLEQLQPRRAYLAVPTRPPAEAGVRAPSEEVVLRAYLELSAKVADVRWLVGYEGTAFAFTGDAEQDLLSITAVHPMDEAAVDEFLVKAGLDWGFVRGLQAQGKIREVEFAGKRFYVGRAVRYS